MGLNCTKIYAHLLLIELLNAFDGLVDNPKVGDSQLSLILLLQHTPTDCSVAAHPLCVDSRLAWWFCEFDTMKCGKGIWN